MSYISRMVIKVYDFISSALSDDLPIPLAVSLHPPVPAGPGRRA